MLLVPAPFLLLLNQVVTAAAVLPLAHTTVLPLRQVVTRVPAAVVPPVIQDLPVVAVAAAILVAVSRVVIPVVAIAAEAAAVAAADQPVVVAVIEDNPFYPPQCLEVEL